MSLKLISLAIIGVAALLVCEVQQTAADDSKPWNTRTPKWNQKKADIKEAKKIVSSLIKKKIWKLGDLQKDGDEYTAKFVLKKGRRRLHCRVKYTDKDGKPALKGVPQCHTFKQNKTPHPVEKW